jgi:DNA-binding response OmpR family regulator
MVNDLQRGVVMKFRLMFVEADPRYLEYLLAFFRAREFEAVGFTDHRQALAWVQDDCIDIVIVDFFIDGCSADVLCAEIARRGGEGPALIVTSCRQSPEIERRIRQHCPAFYLVKPFAVEDLYAVVLKITERREQAELTRLYQSGWIDLSAPVNDRHHLLEENP